MGMDIYGLNPKIRGQAPERPDNVLGLDKTKPACSKEEQDKYFEEKQKYEDENVGVYFRNNVWWWRPLANYIREKIKDEDWFNDEVAQRIHDNSGFQFTEEQALCIKRHLDKGLRSGEVSKRAKQNKVEMKIAEKNNKMIQKKMDKLAKKVEKETGKSAPIDWDKKYKDEWDFLWESRDFRDSYPFCVKNVKAFSEFLGECGGFEIC
tara:strand:- start:1157 stop:1777 length:621 start_codon:yes stop_codon:yes gene_type:complete